MSVFTGPFNWVNAMKIGTKLVLGFLLVLALTMLIGGFSILKLEQVNHVSSELALKWMPAIGHTTTMRSSMLEIRALEVKHAQALDVGYMEEYEEKMNALLAVVTKNSKDYEKMIDNVEGKKLLETYRKAWAEYLTFNAKVVALGRGNKAEDAREIGEGAAKSSMDDAILAVDKLTHYNFTGGRVAAEHANGVYDTAKIWTFGLLAGALLIGMSVAVIITRNLLRQLGGEPRYATSMTTAIAEGKLYVNVDLRAGDTSSLLAGMKDMRDNLVKMVTEVRSGIDTISTASTQIAAGNLDLSARTEQQASSLEETASSMEQLTSTVKQNADSARQANQLAVSASNVAVKGGEVVAQVITTMGSINDSARKIVDIIGVIDSIAFQTNILALNAAVEAARAGEQGRGFAVVASEVRNLAQRSAAAAKEIKMLIGDSVEKVDAGSKLVGTAGSTMNEIVESVKRVTEIMAEIMVATEEQSSGIEQVSQAIGQMDQVTQQNAALVEEAAAAAESLQDQARHLAQVVSVFKLDGTEATMRQDATPRIEKPAVLPSSSKIVPSLTSMRVRANNDVAPRRKVVAVTATTEKDWEEF